jgi:very-short-patch-repair endonuclease
VPTIEQQLTLWQQELLDLTNGNRLLNFRPSTARPSSLHLVAPDAMKIYETLLSGKPLTIACRNTSGEESSPTFETAASIGPDGAITPGLAVVDQGEQPSIASVEQTLATAEVTPRATSYSLKPGMALSSVPCERTNRVALRLSTQARASEQEQGINILFAVFGLLKWNEKPGDDTWRYAPLVMLPLKIEESVREHSFRILASGDDPEFNQTLAERLKRDFGLSVSVELDEEAPLTDVFKQLKTAVSKYVEWQVIESVHVGLFQFHKLRMYRDLTDHAAVAVDHEIIQALGLDGVGISPLPEGIPTEDELDRVVTPDTSFTVRDADSSQLRVIQATVRGGHLIIQGPPGTGKSQTIANIIAESIARGKTVLFVSEKAAAIEVVHHRLSERGLGDFCLMLHSHKATKKDVINALGSRLEPQRPPPASVEEELNLKRLGETRARLNAYAEALHRERPTLRQSTFWAHGQLAALHAAPYLQVAVPSVEDLTLDRLDEWIQILRDVARYEPALSEGSAHPWSAIRVQEYTFAEKQSLRQSLQSTLEALRLIESEGNLLANHLGLPGPEKLRDARALARVADAIPEEGGLRQSWFDRGRNEEALSVARQAAEHAAAAAEIRNRLSTAYAERLLKLPLSDVIASYERGGLARFLSRSHREHRALVRAAARDARQQPVSYELALLRSAAELDGHLAWFRHHHADLTRVAGFSPTAEPDGDLETWRTLVRNVEAAAEMLRHLPPGPPSDTFFAAVGRSGAGLSVSGIRRRLTEAVSTVDTELSSLRSHFDPSLVPAADNPFAEVALPIVRSWIAARLLRADDLDQWLRANMALDRARASGIGEIAEQLLAHAIPADCWTDALRRLLLTHWLDWVYRYDETLRSFHGEEHEDAIARFRGLDRWYIGANTRRIRRELAERQSLIRTDHGGEPQLLRHEHGKRKRHIPLRRLFERIPNLLPTLKPCLMMSPLSVAHFLPADRYKFDIVIFDEASQVRPHDAIGAIMRGRQLVVAGDEHQLPPTTFFDRQIEDQPDEEGGTDLRELESILKALQVRGIHPEELRWHYRSRHEDLIAFSNHKIYDGRLITFPTAETEPAPTRGVSLEYVPNAQYVDERDRVLRTSLRVNRTEARRIAALVVHHARTRPNESLGVVTLGMNQRDVVDEEIKNARQLDASTDAFFSPDRPEPFFVKALEQVQGDERDVIMIGIGYGKNAEGVLSHNFGPINQDGGERRLNVLVTRAKYQVIVVSSIRAADIDLAKTQKLGPRLLKMYLDFAERGRIALDAEATGGDGEYESPFEAQVGEALSRAGFIVRRQVGASRYRIDLAVVDPDHPGRYLLGIECDGATYHSSKTARDRDRLRQEVLEGLGWTIHRIWSTAWVQQPDRELNRVIERIQRIRQQPRQSPHPEPSLDITSASDQAHDPENGPIDLSAPPVAAPAPLAVPYQEADLRRFAAGDILSVGIPTIGEAVVACVSVEGPIHQDLLARRIATAWGFQRTGPRIAARIATAVDASVAQRRIDRRNKFLWLPGQSAPSVRGTSLDGATREVGHIPDEEILNGMLLVLGQAYSLSEGDLIQQTARLFGYSRTGPDIARRFRELISSSHGAGVLDLQGERFKVAR